MTTTPTTSSPTPVLDEIEQALTTGRLTPTMRAFALGLRPGRLLVEAIQTEIGFAR